MEKFSPPDFSSRFWGLEQQDIFLALCVFVFKKEKNFPAAAAVLVTLWHSLSCLDRLHHQASSHRLYRIRVNFSTEI